MGRWFVACLLVVWVAACKRSSRAEEREGCLPLPAAPRMEITVGPDGTSLYWLERTRHYSFDADLVATWRVMRYDLRSRKTESVIDNVTTPIRFIGGQLVVIQARADTNMLVLLGSDLHTQALTPDYLDVTDVELLDSHTLVFLADGDGARALYTLDLSDLRHYHLADADILLSTSSGRVFARQGDSVLIVDAKTHAVTRTRDIRRALPQGEHLVHVENDNVVMTSMVAGSRRTVSESPRKWRLVYQGDTTLARTRPTDDKSYAFLISGARVKPLPTVLGGASITGAVELAGKTWALVGHNTQNYIGDLIETPAEADVCLLPASKEVTYPTRETPARFVERSRALFDALAAAAPSATMQFGDWSGDPTTISINLLNEPVGRDFEKMRKRTLELHDLVTRQLADREIRTEVIFADRRVGIHRWRRDRLRYRTTVGMGDALISNPADFDFEVTGLDNKKVDGKITCAGSLRNLRKQPVSVDLKCSGNRGHIIHFDNLAPDEARPFSQTFDVTELGEYAYVEVMLDGKPYAPRNADLDARNTEITNVAMDVYDATELWLTSHQVSKGKISIDLFANPTLLDLDSSVQDAKLKAAYDGYAKLRAIYGLPADAPIQLDLGIRLSDVELHFDGTQVERE